MLKNHVIPSRCSHYCALRAAFGGCALYVLRHSGVGISWIFKLFLHEFEKFHFYLGDCHTSLRAGSQ